MPFFKRNVCNFSGYSKILLLKYELYLVLLNISTKGFVIQLKDGVWYLSDQVCASKYCTEQLIARNMYENLYCASSG